MSELPCTLRGRNMAEFNLGSNARGRNYMVMVLEAEKGGEGVEFHAVRHEFLLDVPEGLSMYKQRCGRVVRCGSHSNLPEGERTVRFMFSAAKFPQFAQHECLGIFFGCETPNVPAGWAKSICGCGLVDFNRNMFMVFTFLFAGPLLIPNQYQNTTCFQNFMSVLPRFHIFHVKCDQPISTPLEAWCLCTLRLLWPVGWADEDQLCFGTIP